MEPTSPDQIEQVKQPTDSSPESKPSTQTPKLEKLFGHSFEIPLLNAGDTIPVGGEAQWTNDLSVGVVGDIANLEGLIEEMEDLNGKYNLDELKKWLESSGIDIDENTFGALSAFSKILEKKYPDNPDKSDKRLAFYRAKGKQPNLSEVFEQNLEECAEIAALTQYYLQRKGIKSKYFSGEALWSKDQEFPQPHSFILIEVRDKKYIFDPTNPTDTTQGKFPSIYTTAIDFDSEVRKNQQRFITATNIISKKEAHFGVGGGTNVMKANIL